MPLVSWPAANYLRGVLRQFSLEDCVRALGGRMMVLEPWDAKMAPA